MSGAELFNELSSVAAGVFGLGIDYEGNRVELTVQTGTKPPNELYVVRVGDLTEENARGLLQTIGVLPTEETEKSAEAPEEETTEEGLPEENEEAPEESEEAPEETEESEEASEEEEGSGFDPNREKRKVTKSALTGATDISEIIWEIHDSDPKFDAIMEGSDDAEALKKDIVDGLVKIQGMKLNDILKAKKRPTFEAAVEEFYGGGDDGASEDDDGLEL